MKNELFDSLIKIIPSKNNNIEYYPCKVFLKDNQALSRVYIVEANAYKKHWGNWPWDDPRKKYILIENVIKIEESPYRIPAKLANKMYGAGESGMGYCVFTLIHRDGRKLPYVMGNAIDFPSLPSDVNPKDFIDLLPHTGGEYLQDQFGKWREDLPYTKGADYYWCLYSK